MSFINMVQACQSGDVRKVAQNLKEEYYDDALRMSCYHNRVEVVKYLLNQNLLPQDISLEIALRSACLRHNTQTIEFVLSLNPDTFVVNDCVLIACKKGQLDLLKILEPQADVAVKNLFLAADNDIAILTHLVSTREINEEMMTLIETTDTVKEQLKIHAEKNLISQIKEGKTHRVNKI